MPDEDPKTDPNRYYLRPGCTEPELRPEFVEEEAAVIAEEEPEAAPKKRATKKAASKPASKKR